MKQLFLSAIDNPGAPNLDMPKIHVAYGWDLTKGQKKQDDITPTDIQGWARSLPTKAHACIDLEPTATEPNSFCFNLNMGLDVVRKSCDRMSALIKAAKAVRPDLILGTLYCPFAYSQWDTPEKLRAKAMVVASHMTAMPDVIDFDVYRIDPDRTGPDGRRLGGDEWYDRSLAKGIRTARMFDLPVRAWMSPARHLWLKPDGSLDFLPLTQFRSDLIRVASELEPDRGDRIVGWLTRVKPGPTPGSTVMRNWDPSWDWHLAFKGVAEECGA